MKLNICGLAMVAGFAGLVMPGISHAQRVGEYISPSCGEVENLSIPAAAAGYTWRKVNSLDAAGISGLDGLYIRQCQATYSKNAAVDNAVASGMALVLDTAGYRASPELSEYGYLDGNQLPGSPAVVFTKNGGCYGDYSLAANSPIVSGPGGTLTDDSYDVGGPGGEGGFCTFLGGTLAANLPAGIMPLFTFEGYYVTAIAYTVGSGKVVAAPTQMSYDYAYTPVEYSYAGAKTFYINAMAWALGGVRPAQTCASEGYTGTKLTWCQNICEKGYTGSTLSAWIKRWTDKYRDLPYCAREK